MVRRLDPDDTDILLAQHSSEIRALADGLREMSGKFDRVFQEIHSLSSTLTVLGAQPSFSVADILDNILKVGAIAGLGVGAILYVNQAFVAEQFARLTAADERFQERIDRLSTRSDRLEGVLIYKGAGLAPDGKP